MRPPCVPVIRAAGALAAAVVFFAMLALPFPAQANADKRVALVIGNGAYKTAPQLANPPFDAKAVSASLKRLGFQVIEGYDLTMAQMRGPGAEFPAPLPHSQAAIRYFS